MPHLHENSLQLAEALLDGAPFGSAARRRAISTAYYAVFQGLSALCAARLSQSFASTDEFRRAYRVLDHKLVREALSKNTEFKDRIGTPFAQLQDVRYWADYSIAKHPDEAEVVAGKRFASNEARELVKEARNTILYIDSLDAPAQQRLMVLLVVRDRR